MPGDGPHRPVAGRIARLRPAGSTLAARHGITGPVHSRGQIRPGGSAWRQDRGRCPRSRSSERAGRSRPSGATPSTSSITRPRTAGSRPAGSWRRCRSWHRSPRSCRCHSGRSRARRSASPNGATSSCLCERLAAEHPDLAGIVIGHGTATLEETAYALSLTLTVDLPVVLVGSQRPMSALSTDAKLNLVAAVRTAATPDIPRARRAGGA